MPLYLAVEFFQSGGQLRRRARLHWKRTTIQPPVSRIVDRAIQTGSHSVNRFAAVQVPSLESGAQAGFLCGKVQYGQITGAVRVISRRPDFRGDGRRLRVDTFRIDLCKEVSGVSPWTTLQISISIQTCTVLRAKSGIGARDSEPSEFGERSRQVEITACDVRPCES